MKRLTVLLIIMLMLFSFNTYAQESKKLNTEIVSNSEDLSLPQEKRFSQSAREELLGIASRFDSEDAQNIEQFNFESNGFSFAETTLNNSQHLNLLTDLTLAANYSQTEDDELKTAAGFKLEYKLNSRTLIRAGYSLQNEEWWGVQNNNDLAKQKPALENNGDSPAASAAEDSSLDSESANNNFNRVYQNEVDSSRSLGVAYRSSERVTLSADFIDNNEFGSYYNEDWEISGDSTVFGLEYNYPEGSTIKARYQVDTSQDQDVTQRITGLDFAFNNLATFSASYKLLDLKQLENTLTQQKTAWDLGIGVNLNENYGVALGYELIESADQEESEKKIKASFEINF